MLTQGEYMSASPSGAGNSSSLPPPNVVTESAASRRSNQGSVGKGGVPKAVLAIWNKLSASLIADPSANWNHALNTAEELALSVCGQNLDAELQADLLANFRLLEQTLSGLKIKPTDEHPNPHCFIKDRLAVLKLNIVADAQDLKKLQDLIASPPNESGPNTRSALP